MFCQLLTYKICISGFALIFLFTTGCNTEPNLFISPTPTSSPTPISSPIPTSSPTPIFTPIPIIHAIASAMLPIISGQGVPGAAVYDSDEPGPHPVMLMTTSGTAYVEKLEEVSLGGSNYYTLDDWNELLPYEWSPASINETELVVLIGPEQEYNLGYQTYSVGPNITAYQYEVDMELRESRTGQTLATYTFKGSDPRPFPEQAPINQKRLEGTHLLYTDLEAWLCHSVTPKGCWIPLKTLEGWVDGTAFSPDGQTLASWGFNGNTIELRRVSDGTLLRTLELETNVYNVSSVALSPDRRILASGSSGGIVQLWQVSDGTLLRTLEGHTDLVDSMAFSPDGQSLTSVASWIGDDLAGHRAVQLWRVSDGTLLRTLEGQQTDSLLISWAFSPDGQTFATVTDDTTIQLWRASDGTLLHTLLLSTLEGPDNRITSVTFSPDGQTLASGSSDTTLWRVSDGTLLRTLEGWVDGTAFSPDGQTLASEESFSGTVQLWRVSDGTLLRTIEGQTDLVTSVTLSPEGQILASWEYNTVHLWRVSDGTLLRTLEAHEGDWVNGVTFSPDGQTLVLIVDSGTGEDTIATLQLWRVSDGALLRTLLAVNEKDPEITVTFSPDGQTLVAQYGTTVDLWQLR